MVRPTTSLHNFRYAPKGLISSDAEGIGVYYQDTRGNWFRDNFNADGVFQKTKNYNFSQVLSDELDF